MDAGPDPSAATFSRQHAHPNVPAPRTAAEINQSSLGIVQCIGICKQTCSGHRKLPRETLAVGQEPALDRSDRDTNSYSPGHWPPGKQAWQQLGRTWGVMVEITQDQPVHMLTRPVELGNAGIEIRRARASHQSKGLESNQSDQPLGHRDVGVSLYGEVDKAHLRKS